MGKRKASSKIVPIRSKTLVPETDHVWPPTLVGKRKASFTDPYVHDSDADVTLTLHSRTIDTHRNAVTMNRIIGESVKCDQCPVYVFPTSAEGFIRATYVDVHSEENWRMDFPKLSARWTLKYATVEDMAAIDPHRKLVNWIPIQTSKEINKYDLPIHRIGTPQCLSETQMDEFEGLLQNLEEAENVEEIDSTESEEFESKLTSVLFQDGMKSGIQHFLKMMTFRHSHMKKAFAFGGVRVANATFERLSSLGVLLDENEHAAKAFTSKMIYRGTERELDTLDTTIAEIEHAKATRRLMTQLELDHLESTRVLMEKQNKETFQHLVEWATKSQILTEEAMMSRVKLITSLRQTEKEASILQKFISSGATEIVEETYSDALKEDEKALKEKEKALKKKEKAYSDALKEKEQELIEKAKSNQECCICYHGLEGFSVATSEDGEKRHKRACFLPCMHANVCTTCSEKRWNEGPKKCPICRQQLTERPRVIYL